MATAARSRQYEDFQPPADWVRDDGANTVVLDLPGFEKKQLQVQLDNLGILNVTGEQRLDQKRWRRFRREFRIPDNSDLNGIRAKFEKGVLYVIIPVAVSPAPRPPAAKTEAPPTEEKPRQSSERFESPGKGSDGGKEGQRPARAEGVAGSGGDRRMQEVGRKRAGWSMVNVAAALLVIVGLGVYIFFKFWPAAEAPAPAAREEL